MSIVVKWLLITPVIFTVFILAGCDSEPENIGKTQAEPNGVPKKYARFYKFEDAFFNKSGGEISHVLGPAGTIYGTPSGIKLSIKQLSVDPEGKVFGPNPLQSGDEVRLIPQCGIYEITVTDHGEPVFCTNNFKYSGEDFIEVARGIGWSVYITTENWNDEL